MLHIQIVSDESEVLASTNKEYLDKLIQDDGMLAVSKWIYAKLDEAEKNGY